MTTEITQMAPAAASAVHTGLARQKHWATRSYHEFLLARARMPFAWGSNDCALFAADGICAMTGIDIAAAFRGQYDDETSAAAAIARIAGGSTVADAAAWCAAQHGLGEWPHRLRAQRGDLVVFENGGRLIAGLVHLSGAHLVSVSESGLVRVPVSRIQRSWHVGPASVPAAVKGKSNV